MLSGAKHLVFPFENEQKQILRFAQDDMPDWLFQSVLECGLCRRIYAD
jgi:hypothetical protein